MYKPIWLRMVTLLSVLLTISCASHTPRVATPVTDEERIAATEQARRTLDTLLGAIIAPKDTYDFLGVKVRFSRQDGSVDDNWVEPVDYYDGIFTIRMMDGLTYNTNLHADHTLDVPLKRVLDWMIVEKDGNLIGGYTIRLEYKHMSTEQQEEFLKVTGYKIK